jgi:uncharacterized protein
VISGLSKNESYALLRGCRLGRLGCVAEGEPYVVPVNYVFDGECILIHSLPGRKIEAMRARPRVCFQVDERENQMSWKSVLAFGAYEEITDDAERERVMNCLLSVFPQLTPVESLIASDAAAPVPIVFRIRVERVTGVMEG